MGIFRRSLLLLLFTIVSPLIYRQFASESTVKSLSSYYSNYKTIDQFLRQTANQLDSVKDYLYNSEQFEGVGDKLNRLVDSVVLSLKKDENLPQKKKSTDSENGQLQERYCQCSNEDLKGKNIKLWSKDELSRYDGAEQKVYLGFLGIVYDVTGNKQHYAKGADYNMFAGRDASRAFVTGNFTHDLQDSLDGLERSSYLHIESWESFYKSSYPELGRIEGYFYDSKGCATSELKNVIKTIQKLKQEKLESSSLEKELPDCNSEWNADLKAGRVWCTTKSGGVERSWVGVPRMYNNGETSRCACFNIDGPGAKELSKFMSVYPDCDPKADECKLKE